ncbi:hypothetical protein CEY16_05195 [Halalkalibacillus sediminis]|uniref:YtxH domain-containing protein n=1 Tax=Halalkalibacillus sediminis TaxID=2018042 RepID=A0A2I0QXV4_9BACI|nr:YtxH domain-containing protein [Halalkalibacillus sediminis]PKR79149.1 hypothetical protein CEY16_05195 [Halalkalibacillus sediminis]
MSNENQSKKNTGVYARTVTGSLVGAAAGFLLSPENRKKANERVRSIDREQLKAKSNSAKEKVQGTQRKLKDKSGEWLNNRKDQWNGFKEKRSNHDESGEWEEYPTEVSNQASGQEQEELQQLKEQNNELADRMTKLEEQITKFIETNSANSKKPANSSSSKNNNSTNSKKNSSNSNSKQGTKVDSPTNEKESNNAKKSTKSNNSKSAKDSTEK